jgi:hypothetical protein
MGRIFNSIANRIAGQTGEFGRRAFLITGKEDGIAVFKAGKGTVSYFDFPNTLLTLDNLVEYKVPSREGSLAEEKKRELGCAYIRVFMETVRRQAELKRLTPYLYFTGPALEGLETEEPGK